MLLPQCWIQPDRRFIILFEDFLWAMETLFYLIFHTHYFELYFVAFWKIFFNWLCLSNVSSLTPFLTQTHTNTHANISTPRQKQITTWLRQEDSGKHPDLVNPFVPISFCAPHFVVFPSALVLNSFNISIFDRPFPLFDFYLLKKNSFLRIQFLAWSRLRRASGSHSHLIKCRCLRKDFKKSDITAWPQDPMLPEQSESKNHVRHRSRAKIQFRSTGRWRSPQKSTRENDFVHDVPKLLCFLLEVSKCLRLVWQAQPTPPLALQRVNLLECEIIHVL